MKIKIFNTISKNPKDAEHIMQEWLDTFKDKPIVIKHVCHEFIDNDNVIQTLFIYDEVPVSKE